MPVRFGRLRAVIGLAGVVLPLLSACIIIRQPHTPRVGTTWNRSHYYDFEPLVGSQQGIDTYSSNPWTTGWGLYYERAYSNGLLAGLYGRQNQHTLNQTFLLGSGYPPRVDATVNAWFAGPYVGWRTRPRNWLDARVTAGPVFTRNSGVFVWRDNDILYRDHRTHYGFNTAIGTSMDVGPWNNWGLTVGYKRTNFFRKDADNNNTIHLGAWFDYVRIARNTPPSPVGGGTRPRTDSTRQDPRDSTQAPPVPRPPGDTSIAPPRPPRPPGDTTIAPPRPPRDSTPPVSGPPGGPPPSRPDSQESRRTCCGFRRGTLTYPKLTDPRQPPGVQAAAWSTAVAASNVLLPNGDYFHQAQDIGVPSVGFPLDWSRHYLSSLGTTAGGMIGHRWDFTLDKRILPLSGTDVGEGLVQELPGRKSTVIYFNGQGRGEIYAERMSNRRDFISNFGTGFSAYVTVYTSPPGAFHEIERYALYNPDEHPFKEHPNVDDANGEAIFYVLREKNGLRYVFNCRGQLIHILSRHDYTSSGALHPAAEKDSVRITIEYREPLNPLTQSPMPFRIRDTANRIYGIVTRNIGTALVDTNFECVHRRGSLDIPRIWKLSGNGLEVEYLYQGGSGDAILEGVRVTSDSLSGTTRYRYDAEHRLTSVTPPKQAAKARNDSATITNTYDSAGRVTQQQLGGGLLSWTVSYNGTTRVNAVNGGGDEWEYQLRQVGPYYVTATEILRSRDGAAEGGPWVTRFEHNASTQVTRLTLPRGNIVRYEYDGGNDPVTLGRIRDFNRGITYDNDLSLGNLLRMIQDPGSAPNGPRDPPLVTRYAYEPLFNQMLRETDPRGSVTEYEYRYTDKGEFGNPVRIKGPSLSQPDGSRAGLEPVRYTYNKKGQVATIVDQRGSMTTFTYAGPAWYLKQVEYPGRGVRTYEVDLDGRVTEEGGTFGTTRYTRDSRGRVVMREVVVDANTSNRTWFEYDLHNQVTRTRHEIKDNFQPGARTLPSGTSVTLPSAPSRDVFETTEYDLLDRPVREVIAGVERRYQYDRRGNIAAMITPSPDGTGVSRTEFEYDARGLVLRRTPGLDESIFTTFEYDQNANLTYRVSGPDARRGLRWTHDAFDRVILQIDGRGTTLRRELDANGNTVREIMSGLSGDIRRPGIVRLAEIETRYNELNSTIAVRRHHLNAARTIDEGRAFYNSAGDLVRVIDAGGDERRFEYDEAGRTIAVIGADITTRTTYDHGGRATLVTEIETERTYTSSNGQTVARDASRTTAFTYDAAGRITHKGGAGPEVRFWYDSRGQVRAQYEASHGLTENQYDALGQLILTQRGPAFERFSYLPSGHLSRHETPGSARSWRYDAMGRIIETKDDKSGAITFTEWNASGDQFRTLDPNGTSLERTYDATGLPTRLDIRYGRSVVNDNGTNRPTLIGPEWESYEYDGLGRMLRAVTSQGISTTLQYDGVGRVTAEEQERNGIRHRLTRSYANDHSWNELIYPEVLGSVRARHLLSPTGRVERVDLNGRTIAQFAYSGSDRLATRTYANRAVTSYQYDVDRRIIGAEVSAPGSNAPFVTWWTSAVTYRDERVASVRENRRNQGGAPISASETQYAYDAAGRRVGARSTNRQAVPGSPDAVSMSGTLTQYDGARPSAVGEYTIDDATGEVTLARHDRFDHDAALRVSAVTSRVRLDAVASNRGGAVSDVATIGTLVGQRTAATERQGFQYDRAGNLIADTAYIYSYDHANRLTRVTERSNRGFKEYIYFQYDALGRRVFMHPDREQTQQSALVQFATWQRQTVAFIYDGQHVIGEVELGNERASTGVSMLARYVMGARPGDRIRMDRRQNDDAASPLATYYLHENAQGSLALASDSAGRPHWIGYPPAAGGTAFRAPNDLHTIANSRTRSPYLSGPLRVDGFSGIRFDENTRQQIHDFRDNVALSTRIDLRTMREQIQAFQATSLAAMSAVAAAAIGGVAATSVGAIFELTLLEAAKPMLAAGLASVGAGFATAWWQGSEYTPSMAAYDFGEGALLGLVGGAMVKAGASLGAMAAVDFATGYVSGFVRALPTEGFSGSLNQGAMHGAFGAVLGLGIGVVGKWYRSEPITLTDWHASPLKSYSMPDVSKHLELQGLNGRWQRESRKPEPLAADAPAGPRRFTTHYSDRGVTADERFLERAVLRHLRNGTRASRLIAELIEKGELKVRFWERIDSKDLGNYHPGTDFVVVNINHAAFRNGNLARQVAAVVLHEGIHYLGGGELAAWFAHAKFLMSAGHLAAPPGLRFLTRRAQPVGEFFSSHSKLVKQGAEHLAFYINPLYKGNVLGVNDISGHVLRAGGMAKLIGMTRPQDLDVADTWLRSWGRFNTFGIPERWW